MASTVNKEKITTNTIVLGFFIGLFPFIHMAVFGVMGIALLAFFLIYPKIRKQLFLTGLMGAIVALPQIVYMGGSEANIQLFNPGYLIENLSVSTFVRYWFMNLGISIFTILGGFILAKKSQRKVFLPFLLLFITGNLFQFSVEVAANHKFFNLFIIGGNFFTAFFLVKLWESKVPKKIAAVVLTILLTA